MSLKGKYFKGYVLQHKPTVICASVPGEWLLERTTPSWRIQEPITGFQRMVREKRAREIALAVLDQGRSVPNAIVLATDSDEIYVEDHRVFISEEVFFLVVDGQHRLWAQFFSENWADYACMIHVGLRVEDMARLFLEINETQKRVPSSLRWDLMRLVRPDDDPEGIDAAELVYMLATEKESPFFQRIDLTGEQSEIYLKQGSLAPEFKLLISRRSPLREFGLQQQYEIILDYSLALRERDADNWGKPESSFFKARVLRALFKLLGDIFRDLDGIYSHSDDGTDFDRLPVLVYLEYLERIDESTLDPELIRAMQGSAGIAAIYKTIRSQVF